MELGVNGFEAISGDMRVDLRSRNVGMAKQFLHDTQIGSPFQKMGRKGMTKGVWRDHFGDAGKPRVFFDQLPNKLPR